MVGDRAIHIPTKHYCRISAVHECLHVNCRERISNLCLGGVLDVQWETHHDKTSGWCMNLFTICNKPYRFKVGDKLRFTADAISGRSPDAIWQRYIRTHPNEFVVKEITACFRHPTQGTWKQRMPCADAPGCFCYGLHFDEFPDNSWCEHIMEKIVRSRNAKPVIGKRSSLKLPSSRDLVGTIGK